MEDKKKGGRGGIRQRENIRGEGGIIDFTKAAVSTESW